MEARKIVADALESGVLLYLKDGELAYKAKKGQFSDAIRNSVRQHKVAIIEYLQRSLQQQQVHQRANLAPIEPRQLHDRAPLSFAQQRLWFLGQLEGANAAYHIPAALRLTGLLSATALQRALDTLLERHEVLRTVFEEVEGEPCQKIQPARAFALERIDLRTLGTEAGAAQVSRLAEVEADAPFDLSTGPLIRGRLIQLADDEHVLLVTMHHIVADGWSLEVLVGELSTLYRVYGEGRENPLPALAIQYADYAAWQRQWLQGETLRAQLDYWRTHLRDAPALLELPTDRPRPAVQSFRGASAAVVLGRELSDAVKELAARTGLTVHMVLYAAWAALLGRLSGQEQVVVGTPVANRQRRELEGLIGFFVNTLALRVDLRGAPTVRELLGRVRETSLGAYAHQDVPFERIVEELQPARSLSHSPLFQVMFGLETVSQDDLTLAGLQITSESIAQRTTPFDLVLSLEQSVDGISGALEYATDLFEARTVERWADCFTRLLAGMVADVDGAMGAIPILSPEERARVLVDFNASPALAASEPLLHRVFEQHAARQPGALAVLHGAERVSYGELNAGSNRLARELIERGVMPGTTVGLYLPRSIALLEAMFGVLKTGAAFVVLDPEYPAPRLAQMCAAGGVDRLLCVSGLHDSAQQLRATRSGELLVLDEPATRAQLAARDAANPDVVLNGAAAAYAYFTSGSTGRPKGALNSHAGVMNQMSAMANAMTLTPADRVLQFAALGFDVVIEEIFPALLSGAAVVLRDEEGLLDGQQLQDLLSRNRITVCELMASYWSGWLAHLQASGQTPPRTLRLIMLGADKVSVADYRAWHVLSSIPVLNVFGLTETGCTSLVYRPDESLPAQGYLPTGRPLPNTLIYVLDALQQPVPTGVPGELYIGGVGVGLGYVGDAGQTAERFLSDPFIEASGARLYRTGDMARWLADGNLEFIGRRDNQVKLRGFRIELGEIEAALVAQPGIREAAVLLHEPPGPPLHAGRLIAYVTLNTQGPVTAEELRRHLKERLPEHMVPSLYRVLDSLPLTSNGKVDRKALPAPDVAELQAQFEPPETPSEIALAQVWSELLGVAQVGRHDNFFELGGHSLLAIRVVAMVQARLSRELGIRDLFEYPRLHELAARLATARSVVLRTITRADRAHKLPLSWAQQRLWFLSKLEGANAAYHIPAALRIEGELSVEALTRTLDTLLERHEVLRTVFREEQGEPHQFIEPVRAFALRRMDLASIPPAQQATRVAALTEEEAHAPFDLSAGPLIRGQLLTLSARNHVLLVTMHHIASDAWSMDVLVGEINTAYAAHREGRAPALPALAVQYADYAVWQRQWLQGEELQRQLGYWRAHLHGAPALLELPTDRPRPAAPSHRGASVDVTLGAELSAAVKRVAAEEGVTVHMMLYAAWVVLLARLSGQEQIVVGTPVANRPRRELEGIIGFFINTLALRADLGGEPTGRELLARVRRLTLEGYSHQDLPFERIVEELQPVRSSSHTPLFQALFDLENLPAGELEFAGLTLTSIEGVEAITNFDISLVLEDSPTQIAGGLQFALDLFEPATVARWAGYYRDLVQALVADLDRPVMQLPLVPATERQRLLVDFNQTRRGFPAHALVHELFEARVRRAPDSIAVVYGGARLSLGELNAAANRLAYCLMERGVGPDSRVGLCVARSIDMVVGILAVMKAGGAYVPLDSNYPEDRLRYLVDDARCELVLTQEALRGRVPAGGAIFCLDGAAERAALEAACAGDPGRRPGLDPKNLVYVIYTSGSTGQPKGVQIAHDAAINYLSFAVREYFTDRAGAVVSTSLSFDATVTSLLGPLVAGSCVHLLPEGETDLRSLRDAMFNATVPLVFKVTPAHLEVLQQGMPDGLSGELAHCIVIGGEQLTRRLLAHWKQALLPRATYVNEYGPTETVVGCSIYTVEALADIPADMAAIPIGRPIDNTQLYVVDAHLQPAPTGVFGELLIGGAGVARGYLGRDELTAGKFIADPFGGEPGARVYRSGDVARWLPDGNLEFIGRRDEQVKLHGYRIELGEIEAQINGHAGVKDAVVVLRKTEAGDARLVAYVARSGDELVLDDLRTHLKQHLPEYMVPGLFVMLDALPLTTNGKVDRKALPDPGAKANPAGVYVAPATATEQALAAIWAELLEVARVGRDDNFYELGGHSLLAIRVVATVQERLGRELGIRDLFDHPRLRELAARLDAASPIALQGIERADRSQRLPLSSAQQRLWFLAQLEGANAAYHIPAALRLSGALSVEALQRTLDTVIERHESLRTVFREVQGEAHQHILPASAFALTHVNLTALGGQEQSARVEELAQQEANAAFELSVGPLFRGRLLELSEREHVLLLTMHHIVSDGWSIGVLVPEMNALYRAYRAGAANPLPPLAIQYADYAAWQRRRLQGAQFDQQLDYWREHLRGAPALLELPADRPRPVAQNYRGLAAGVELGRELSAAVKRLAAAEGCTVHMVLYTAWVLLLSRLSGQDQVVVGTPVANRQRSELEGLIGFFVNTLALRADLSGAPTVRELLGRVRRLTLDGYAHLDLPFERIVEELQPVRSMSHSPVFQVVFMFENVPARELEMPGLAFELIETPFASAQFDLTLSLAEDEGNIAGVIEYAAELFEPGTMRRWAQYFRELVQGLVSSTDQPAARLPMVPAAERQQLLTDYNATRMPFSAIALVHELFEAQAAANPAAAAVTWAGRTLGYGELNRRANQLAGLLIERGVGPDSLVGLCVDRSFDMAIGILGVLKAGAGYVPLDPNYPAERLRYLVDDSHCTLVLTQQALAGKVPAGAAELFCLDSAASQALFAGFDSGNPARRELDAGHLVYVIYTSGSTGQPKGVQIAHRGAVNYLSFAVREYFSGRAGAVVSTSLSFDATVTSLLGPLVAGKCVHLLPPDDFAALRDALFASREALVFKVTPAHLDILQQDLPANLRCDLPHCVVVGGEQLTQRSMTTWKRTLLPGATFVNEYGPTETVVGCSIYTIRESADVPAHMNAIPIGKPIDNTQLYVVDEFFEPVPHGVTGELLIGGAGVARGYLNRAELTAQKFIRDPFSESAAARVYRTGDLARWLPDGNLEFLGRRDEQVKLRGFRIELGEIEAQLQDCEEVQEAVVVLHKPEGAEARLIAYVTLGGGPADFDALRSRLQARLPEYMVPSLFIALEQLPLTSNGKVDRKALPEPGTHADAGAHEPPASDTERALAAIWQELLGVERVGRRDNFYNLGGHSLLAIRVVSVVQERLGRELGIRDLFENPRLADLAARLDTAQSIELAAIPRADRNQRLPLSWAQQRLWFLGQLEGANAAYHIPAALRLIGDLSVDALRRTLDTVLERHESLRTVFHEENGDAFQLIEPARGFALTRIDLTTFAPRQQAARVTALAEEESVAPFDLAQGPLIRGSLLMLSATEHVLLVTMHHIVSDGWSMGVLVDEVSRLYAAYHAGGDNPLPAPAIQYADYAVWQRQWLQGATLENQLGYWREHLRGAPALLELPTDRPRPPAQTYRGASVEIPLSAAQSAAVRRFADEQGITVHMVLYTAWVLLLSRLSGQQQIVIGTPVANRQRRELEGLIGFFVNTLALRADLDGDPTVRELLGRVRRLTLDGYAHQDVPFERVVEELQPVRSMSHSPVFQAMFVLQNAPEQDLALTGLQIQPEGVSQHTTPFDLMLNLEQLADRIEGSLEYAVDLFDPQTIARWVGYFTRLLEELPAGLDRPVSALRMLGEEECAELLVAPDATAVPHPAGLLHELIEAQAARTPAAVAAVCGQQSLTYDQLNTQANRLAHYLLGRGVTPDSRVGLCVERSLQMLVGALGILKAGAAYVPLDPNYPKSRLLFVLEDCAASLLISTTSLAGRFDLPASRCVHLDDAPTQAALAACADTNVSRERTGQHAGHLGYVLYTSGSTGKPKGVMVEHRALCNFVHSMQQRPGITSADTVLSVTTMAFDIHVLELYVPLVAGARVVIATAEDAGRADLLAALLERHAVTVMQATPVTWKMLLDDGCGFGPVFKALCGGESWGTALRDRLLAHPGIELWNMYGPTETTVWSAVEKMAVSGSAVLLGAPIDNTRFYVVDRHLNLVPAGVVGELLIGGTGVARGYLNRPELTAERFIADPFSTVPGARVYRTGDLVRRVAGGKLEFVGRTDDQLKLRGYRIELQEIEAGLSEHHGVRDAVAVVRDIGAECQLVAYVTAASTPLETELLRSHLRERLPPYMVPALVVVLPDMPLTANGKIDRKALPAPEAEAFARAAYQPPEGPSETTLAALWVELLGLERVSRSDNFFSLGGHSLLAMRLVSRLRPLGIELPLEALFEHQTLAAVAAHLDRGDGPAVRNPVPLNRSASAAAPLFLVHEISGRTSSYQALAQLLEPHCRVYGLQFAGSGVALADVSVDALARVYIEAIKEVQPEGPYRIAAWSFGGNVAYEMAYQLQGRDEAVEFLGLIDTERGTAEEGDLDLFDVFAGFDDTFRQVFGVAIDTSALRGYALPGNAVPALPAEVIAREIRAGGLSALEAPLRAAGLAPEEFVSGFNVGHALNLASLRYCPAKLPIGVSFFSASEYEGINEPGFVPPLADWRALLGARVVEYPVGGTHENLVKSPSVEVLAAQLVRALGAIPDGQAAAARPLEDSPLVPIHPGQRGHPPIFCIPGAAQSATCFVPLAAALQTRSPIIGLQPRGLDGLTVPHATVEAAAAYYLAAIRKSYPRGRYILLGHSFGGWIAFEMARQAQAAADRVDLLVLIDSEHPDCATDPARGRLAHLGELVEVMEQGCGKSMGITPDMLRHMIEDEQLALLLGRMKELRLLPSTADRELLRAIVNSFLANIRTRYTPRAAFEGPALVFNASTRGKNETVPPEQMLRHWLGSLPGMTARTVAGNHMSMLKTPGIDEIGVAIAQALHGASAPGAGGKRR